jgi:hypothetical protein
MTETPEELKVFEAQLQSIREDMIFDLNMDDLTSIKILLDMVEPHISSDDKESQRAFRHLQKKFASGQESS